MAWSWGGAGSGAASGAATGTTIMPGWGTVIGGVAGGIMGGLFGGGDNKIKNPADSAMPYLNQIPGTISPYYQPYMQAGQQGLNAINNQVMPAYQRLMNDPTAIMNQVGGQFKASPGYQYNVDQATQGANAAAASGGMAGSPAEQAMLAGRISGLASQDYNNYMNQGLGMYGMGLQGMGNMGQYMSTLGYGASNEMAQSLMSQLMSQAMLSYAGQASQNEGSGGGGGGGGLGALGSMGAGGAFSGLSKFFEK